jgi:perosamine synthetase
VKSVLKIASNRFRNLFNFLQGNPITTPSLGSMTLDKDDVEIAKNWLRDRSHWKKNELVTQYETEFACWNGSKFAFAFMGGRVALSACIYALGLKKDDEVILPGYTCVVVPNAFKYAGVKTVYADIELDTYGLAIDEVKKKITSKTKAILLHHLYGLVCRDYEAILKLAKEHKLKVIEDCAHATGAEYKGKKVGNWGDVGFYSSEQSKIFNTIQGGVAVTSDDAIAQKLKEYYNKAPFPDDERIDKQLSNVILNYYKFKHPQRWWRGDIAQLLYGKKRLISTTPKEELGIKPTYYGCRMPASIAVIAINQLKKVDSYNQLRRQVAKRWDNWCETNGYKKPVVIESSTPVFLRYPVMVEGYKKKNISWSYKEIGVTLGVWFVSNIHPVNIKIINCPNANKAVNCCINLPSIME